MFGRVKFRRRSRRQSGFSLIETLCSILILSIGMLGGAVMIMLAATTNNRNKLDNGGTVLSQTVMEMILGQTATGAGNLVLTDCLGNNFNVSVDGAVGNGLGAPLTAAGNIDFSQGKVANYSMVYNSCRATGDPIAYDVRWNVKRVSTNAANTVVYIKQVAVAARPTGAASGKIRNFAIPVTLTGATGQQ